MKVDREGGATSAMHVSPTVAATRFAEAADAGAVIDSMTGGTLPSAAGAEGTPMLRQTAAVQHDKLEH